MCANMATNGLDRNDSNTNLSVICEDTAGLVADLGRLFKSAKFSDVLFIIGNSKEQFMAHSLILKARSLKYHEDDCSGSIYEPNWSPEVFENVLRYIYTGKIELTSTTNLEILKIAAKLKMSKLISKCEEYFLKELSIENCCEFYLGSIHMGIESSIDSELVKISQSFIEENASEVVQTQGFRGLSKDALIQLLTSDKFDLEEEDVWRAVLTWAKHQANVETPLEDCTEYEREDVCKYLKQVINYVRLLLVDSKVFAEEIEPTGAVPMELSLERYRFAAVPQKFDQNDDIRLRPRSHTKRFHGTTILWKTNSKYQSILNHWFGNPHQEWQLIYKASEDGFSSKTFHEKCDDVEKTFTIVQGDNGCICGGFSDVPWKYDKGNGKYSQSSNCFLFNLVNFEGFPPKRFNVIRPKFATLSHISIGPTFGAGPDLYIAHDCNVNTDSCSKLSHSYDGDSVLPTSLMGTVNFKIADYEVFAPK
ncbi:kelch repeat and BTB domain-containing protein 12-like isoform X2 [Dendronephthya gigantea]|uniref:kelch repeat and BTB domain-containing protein 12-like isoform X2 n=1 Tax=Dendronephthya gigantea TaxID=151771 RepID=UPI001069437D|nr:kelch repeat and BTB domain-containing protein 12-like isoform X2 [Dendronephthya gigantea]